MPLDAEVVVLDCMIGGLPGDAVCMLVHDSITREYRSVSQT
jgi:hypothetical protein